MPNLLAPPPQHSEEVNGWEWRDWFYRIWERSTQSCSDPVLPAALATITFEHNLGQVPSDYSVILENATTNIGYSPGERVAISNWSDFMAIESTGNTTIGRIASLVVIPMVHKTTRVITNITISSWRAIIVAKV